VFKDFQKEVELFSAVRHNRYQFVQTTLEADSSKADSCDEHGNSLLLIAAQNNNKRICKLLIKNGANINLQNNQGKTCLHFTHAFKHIQLGQYLQTKGADPGIRNHNGELPHEFSAVDPQEGPQPPASARF
jgi:ankyrin repeat protein